LLALLEAIHQNGVVSGLDPRRSDRIIAYLLKTGLAGGLNVVEQAVVGDAEPDVGIVGFAGARARSRGH
jgi:hypothetical protein